jgi:predicted Zn-dependent protease
MRRTQSLFTVLSLVLCLLLQTAHAADQHSIDAIRDALQSPIPDQALQQARQVDDQILQSGAWNGYKVYLVTGEQQHRVQELVYRLLSSAGASPRGWTVRVLDTDPKVANAFVAGGRYVYVFTGTLEQATSDDELAVVVGHELGHSMLQHNTRRNKDLTTTLATLATVIGQIRGGKNSNAMAIGQALHNSYSRDDEREADAFGVLIANRAGFDPLRGADFFSRQEREANAASGKQDHELADYRTQLLQLKSECESLRQQWANAQIPQTQQNANAINQRCTLFTQAAASYNAAVAQKNLDALQAKTGDHPESQERIAAIAALTDWVHGARSFQDLRSYPQAQKVVAALVQTNNPLVTVPGGTHAQTASNSGAETPSDESSTERSSSSDNGVRRGATDSSTSASVEVVRASRTQPVHSQSATIQQWDALDDALDHGVITKAEYDRKLATLLAKNREH